MSHARGREFESRRLRHLLHAPFCVDPLAMISRALPTQILLCIPVFPPRSRIDLILARGVIEITMRGVQEDHP
jgi:hypothetical protein